MLPLNFSISSMDQAIEIFNLIAEQPDQEYGEVKIVPGWAVAKVYIPNTLISSSISPSMMTAFIAIQKDIFRLAAYAKIGLPESRRLDDVDRHELEILVKVSGGSSQQMAELARPLERLSKLMIGKLTGRQVAIVVLGLGILISGVWGFSAWLEQRKEVQLEEIKSQERLEALRAMKFANEQQRQMFDTVLQRLLSVGPIGERANYFIESSFESLLRSAENNEVSEINGRRITSVEANILRSPARNFAITRFVTEYMRVIDINTSAEVDAIVLMRPDTGENFKIRLSETLFSGADRVKLFDALESRAWIRVELAFREVNGVVRNTNFVRVLE
jgi:hypothetical protein